MIMRVLPVAVFAAGVYKGGDKLKPLLDSVKVVRAQMELRSINTVLTVDALSGRRIEPGDFQEYLRRDLRVPDGQDERDTSLDPWGMPYQIRYEPTRIVIISAGPDAKVGTSDDLLSSVRLD